VAIDGAEIPELTPADFDGCAEVWFDSLADLAASTLEPSEEVSASAHRFANSVIPCPRWGSRIRLRRGLGPPRAYGHQVQLA
jgi:hypothetical protein